MIIEFVFEEFTANPTCVFANKIPAIADSKNNRSYLVNVSANYKNTFKHLFPYTSLSSDVVNKLECLCISLEIVFVDAHELCYP